MSSNKAVNSAIAEYSVLVELLKRGYEAYLAHGSNQLGYDLVFLNTDNPKYIEVKGLGSKNASVKVSDSQIKEEKMDYLVITKFNTGKPTDEKLETDYYILTLKEVKSLYKKNKKGEEGSFTINKIDYQKSAYKNKWDRLK